MRKLAIQCECGQQLQAPRAARGKLGRCPACSREFLIDNETASNLPWSLRGRLRSAIPADLNRSHRSSDRAAKERFGRAVDLHAEGRFAEALAVLEELSVELPDVPEIRMARDECARLVRVEQLGSIEISEPRNGSTFDLSQIESIVAECLRDGCPLELRLKAADLALRLLDYRTRGEVNPPKS